MNGIESSDSIARWAAENPEVRRVWLFGIGANGTHRSSGDIDIAVELEPVEDSEEALTRWIAYSDLWRSQLQSRIIAKCNLEWFDADGGTPTIEIGRSEARVLIYERAS